MRSEVKKMMEADVQGHCLIMSVAVNKRMLWPSRQRSRMRLKLYIVHQKLEEKTVEDQTEDEVESHVDEAMESQDPRTIFRW